jgi:hypothetical protein
MNLPNLTAEASLYKTNKQYNPLSSDFSGALSNAPVVPAYAATALMARNTRASAGASRGWGPIVIGPIIIGPEGDDCIYVNDTAHNIFCIFCPTLSSCW